MTTDTGIDVLDYVAVHQSHPLAGPLLAELAIEYTTRYGGDAEQKHVIFDPIPRLAGIEPSDDPLLELRAAVYLISGRKRREA